MLPRMNFGNWEKVGDLGSGGFGTVEHWKNKATRQELAIKQVRFPQLTNDESDAGVKLRQRWAQEVEMMKKLKHDNVVTAIEVPPLLTQLNIGHEDLPLMAMEYCQGGDLRKVLSKAENTCGLPERQVALIARHIASAIEYLHSRRIIHRDIKPENIVIYRQPSGKVLYKLIDLGYAKELDQSSLCHSYVGTLYYLAPELFGGQVYTWTVDYWSFGMLVFECATGERPFTDQPPAFWHQSVSVNKRPEHICAKFDYKTNSVRMSDRIIQPTYLSMCVRAQLEKWFQLMFCWNNKERGGGTCLTANRPRCFVMLEEMLNAPQVQVFDVCSGQMFSKVMSSSSSVGQLSEFLYADTGLPQDNQLLLLSSGRQLHSYQSIDGLTGCADATDPPIIFLFAVGVDDEVKKPVCKKIPARIQSVRHDCQKPYSLSSLKKIAAHAVYYCNILANDCNRILAAHRAALLNVAHLNNRVAETCVKLMKDVLSKFVATTSMFANSAELDIEEHGHFMHNGCGSNKMLQRWQATLEFSSPKSLEEEAHRLEEELRKLQSQLVRLQKHKIPNQTLLDSIRQNSIEQLKALKSEARNLPDSEKRSAVFLTELAGTAGKQFEELVVDVNTHLREVFECRCGLMSLDPKFENVMLEMTEVMTKVRAEQRKRQKDIWMLMNRIAEHRKEEGFESKMPSVGAESVSISPPSSLASIPMFFEKSMQKSLTLIEDNIQVQSMLQETFEKAVQNSKNNEAKLDSLL